MDIFGIKYRRLCKQLENEGFIKLNGIGCFYNTTYCEYYHKDGRKALCIKELFPKTQYVVNVSQRFSDIRSSNKKINRYGKLK